MPYDIKFAKIVHHDDVGHGYRRLLLDAPGLALHLKPGQFVHVRIPTLEATALRRPFSVFYADRDCGLIELLYKVVGRGTEALAQLPEGAYVGVLGPLGHGFPETCTGVPLLVGGGYGVAPLHFLARRLVAAGAKPIVFVGGRTRGDLLALEDFADSGIEVRAATNDGSFGAKGFVTGPLDDALADLQRAKTPFELFTCGPDGLLKAVAQRALDAGRPGWISMDRHMVCGVGACFACIQPIRRANGEIYNARCCVNGPVFRAEEIVWSI